MTEGCSGNNTCHKAGFDFQQEQALGPSWQALCSRGPQGLQAIAIADVRECQGDAISAGKAKLFLL